MTYNQIAYYILDALKLSGKSSYYNEEHILFLLDKYRSFLLKQKYSDIKKPIPESNFQTICIDVEPTQSPINDCGETLFLKSSNPIPTLSTVGTPFISTGVIQNVRVVYVSRNRFAHVGHNKFLKNMIYCSKILLNYLMNKTNQSSLCFGAEKLRNIENISLKVTSTLFLKLITLHL